MVESVEEFKDELKKIRMEIYRHGEVADVRLVASWLDRMVISLENICPAMELMAEELAVLSEADSVPVARAASNPMKKAPKKAAKKRTKPKKSKRRG